MSPIQLWLVMGFAVERLTELVVKLIPVLEKAEIKAVKVPMAIALVFAIVITLGAPQLDFFKLLGAEYQFPYVGQIVSALFIAGGSELIHKVIKKLEDVRE